MKRLTTAALVTGFLLSSMTPLMAGQGGEGGHSIQVWCPTRMVSRMADRSARDHIVASQSITNDPTTASAVNSFRDIPGLIADLEEPLNSDGRTPERPTGR